MHMYMISAYYASIYQIEEISLKMSKISYYDIIIHEYFKLYWMKFYTWDHVSKLSGLNRVSYAIFQSMTMENEAVVSFRNLLFYREAQMSFS